MSARREFIKNAVGAVAGIAFTGCAMQGRQTELQTRMNGRRREVVVNGRRVKTVDVHAHCVIPEAMALMGRKVEPSRLDMAQDRLATMDAQGIDMEALSINPVWYSLDRERVIQVIRLQNEKLAEVCAAHPERFVAFASLALQFPDLAVQQLDDAVKKLNLRGAAIDSSARSKSRTGLIRTSRSLSRTRRARARRQGCGLSS